jgi:hypothetical protein
MINAPPSTCSSKIRNFITLSEYGMTMKIIVRFVRPDVKKIQPMYQQASIHEIFFYNITHVQKNATYCIRKMNHFATFKVYEYKGKCHNKHWML